ncbi:MAG: formate dehydrogenase family accessory protein FdhD [Dyadobacter sp. 50-39]|uniref:formate dehydrogenase accessory sulfurtransferase FdhD n=1 Tax=Dyadobacter sp. 50-39 TaxID=1895756 RepID=UPI00096513F5|nr:formate dehydrogenase accessory sulfurtransferase FdhD [Dyadobacter sp. 50-39]OJV20212.1 MAG: formate dehydrogenase family accessory protein FdhD [Dyadobacter sp. 50-39]
METSPITSHKITRIGDQGTEELDDQLAVEEPLEIQIAFQSAGQQQRRSISVTMRTPGHDEELAAGFLFTEGIIHSKSQIESISHSPLDENRVVVTCSAGFEPQLGSLERNFYTTSSCGVCGKASIDAIRTRSVYTDPQEGLVLNKDLLYRLVEQIVRHQNTFEVTGGLHASALFDVSGQFLMLREDVGRHNALDKLIGASLLADQLPLAHRILLLSGRASFELIQKAAMAGLAVVAAIGAPSSLAVQLAEESGITLIGFLKKDKFNIYTGHRRIISL